MLQRMGDAQMRPGMVYEYGLAQAMEQGLLPTMEQCAARYAELRADTNAA